MPASHPIPIAPQPHIARRRGNSNDLDTGFRRRHHHDAPHRMPLIGNDHAAVERHRQQPTKCPCNDPLTLIHDTNRVLQACMWILTPSGPRR
jgi:hypothetical protein